MKQETIQRTKQELQKEKPLGFICNDDQHLFYRLPELPSMDINSCYHALMPRHFRDRVEVKLDRYSPYYIVKVKILD